MPAELFRHTYPRWRESRAMWIRLALGLWRRMTQGEVVLNGAAAPTEARREPGFSSSAPRRDCGSDRALAGDRGDALYLVAP